MGVNKVKYGNNTVIDISNDTVTPDKLLQGYTAHDNTGALITGTAELAGDIVPLTVTPSSETQVFDGVIQGNALLTIPNSTTFSTLQQSNITSRKLAQISSFPFEEGSTYYVSGTAKRSSVDSENTVIFNGTWTCSSTWTQDASLTKFYYNASQLPHTTTINDLSWLGFERVTYDNGSTYNYYMVFVVTGNSTDYGFTLTSDLVIKEISTIDGYLPVTVNSVNLDGKVYQDADGYVVLDDDEGTHIDQKWINKTVTPSGVEQKITYGDILLTGSDTTSIRGMTKDASIGGCVFNSDISSLTINDTYRCSGLITIFDNNGVIDTYDINSKFVLTSNTSTGVVYTGDENSYVKSLTIYSNVYNNTTRLQGSYRINIAGTYGVKIDLYIIEVNTYTGLDMVTVEPVTLVDLHPALTMEPQTITPTGKICDFIKNTTFSTTGDITGNIYGATTPSSVLNYGDTYQVTGILTVTDAENMIINTQNIDVTVVMNTTGITIYFDNGNIRFITIRFNDTSSLNIYCPYRLVDEAGTYTVSLNLAFYNVAYGFNSVIIPGGYTTNMIYGLIERSTRTAFELPSGLTKIGSGAFYKCQYIKLSSIPETVTIIEERAFQGCSYLELTTLPNSITNIDQYAFYSCSNLKLTALPNSLQSFGSYAFYSCYNITLSSLPSSITINNIPSYSFYQCRKITLSTLPNNITSIYEQAFRGCTGITNFTLPPNITSISTYAFAECYNLVINNWPDTLTNIGTYAFNSDSLIEEFFCDGVFTSLGSYSFGGTSNHPSMLKKVGIKNATISNLSPAFGSSTAENACQLLEFADLGSTKAIGSSAFQNCNSLETLVLRRSDAICACQSNSFTNTPIAGYNNLTGTVYVPSALISSYQTASSWKTLYNNGTVTFVAIEGSEYEIEEES